MYCTHNVIRRLRNPKLLATTAKDLAIFNTPPGQAWDTSFLPKADQDLRKSHKDYADKKWELEVWDRPG